MSETLVVIRTFEGLLEADEAQIELMNMGIQSLLLSDDRGSYMDSAADRETIALAVHRRDVDVACAVLMPVAAPDQ